MPGLNLSANNYSGVYQTAAPSYGSASSYASGASPAAFNVVGTQAVPNSMSTLHPSKPAGLAFYMGVAAIGALVFIRYSLPN